jgi:hypothetical protein
MVTDTGIEPGINHIGNNLEYDHREGDEHQYSHYYWSVRAFQMIQEQASHAGPGEDQLGHHRTAQQVRGLQRQHRQDRDQVKELKDENPNITKEEATQKLIAEFGQQKEIPKQASDDENVPSKCSTFLFDQKNSDVRKAFKSGKIQEALTILKNLKNEYSAGQRFAIQPAVPRGPSHYRDRYRDNDWYRYRCFENSVPGMQTIF